MSKDADRIEEFFRKNPIHPHEVQGVKLIVEGLTDLKKRVARTTVLSESRVGDIIKALTNI